MVCCQANAGCRENFGLNYGQLPWHSALSRSSRVFNINIRGKFTNSSILSTRFFASIFRHRKKVFLVGFFFPFEQATTIRVKLAPILRHTSRSFPLTEQQFSFTSLAHCSVRSFAKNLLCCCKWVWLRLEEFQEKILRLWILWSFWEFLSLIYLLSNVPVVKLVSGQQ